MRTAPVSSTNGTPSTRRFVGEIQSQVALPDHVSAEDVAREIVAALSERLTPGGAHLLLNALPESLGKLFQDCIEQHASGPSSLDRTLLIERTAEHFHVTPARAEAICRAVLHALREQLAKDVANHVAAQLPHDLKDLWYSIPPPGNEPKLEPEELAAEVFSEIEALAPLPPGVDATSAFTAVMCIFSQRLSGGEARHVLIGLPQSLRPLVNACMLHRSEKSARFHKNEFLTRVSEHLKTSPEASEKIVRAVFSAVRRCLPSKDVEDVASQLPTDLLALWRAA